MILINSDGQPNFKLEPIVHLKPLDVVCMDLKAAFDSVDTDAVPLEGIGTPTVIMDLIHDLPTSTTSRVRIGDEFSSVMPTTSGVCKGCLLAPDVFCRGIDWLMSRVQSGGNLRTEHVWQLRVDLTDLL